MSDWWNQKPLDQLSDDEWEALCDGCAKCCLHKFEDDDSGELFYTGIRCRHLDEHSCRCADYKNRSSLTPDCIELRAADGHLFESLPATCAYRLRYFGMPLPEWHPLMSGTRESVHTAGVSIRGRTISEEYVHPEGYNEHIVQWIN